MPVIQDPKTKKWKIGKGKPIYNTKKDAEAAYKGYLGDKYVKNKKKKK